MALASTQRELPFKEKETLHGVDLIQQVAERTAVQEQLPKQKLRMTLKAEKLCCGVWEKVGQVTVEAVEDNRGNLMFLNPVKMPRDWDRFTISCTREE